MGENTSQHNPNNETKCISSSSSANLQKKLKNLQKEYKTFAKSSSKTMKNQVSHKKCNSNCEQVSEFDTSPRNLMAALQVQNPTTRRRKSLSMSYCSPSIVAQSSGQVWRVRENELAKEEIRRERKHAFESGKLRGRRLFEDESELSYEDYDDDDDDDDEYDVYSVCDEKIVEVEEVVKKVDEESKMIKLGDDDDDDVKKCRLAFGKNKKMFITLALMVLVIGIIGIILLGGLDGYGSDLKVVIPPT